MLVEVVPVLVTTEDAPYAVCDALVLAPDREIFKTYEVPLAVPAVEVEPSARAELVERELALSANPAPAVPSPVKFCVHR